MKDEISKVLEASTGPNSLVEDCFKVAEIFAKETGQEFVLQFFREKSDPQKIKEMADKVYSIAMLQMMESMKASVSKESLS